MAKDKEKTSDDPRDNLITQLSERVGELELELAALKEQSEKPTDESMVLAIAQRVDSLELALESSASSRKMTVTGITVLDANETFRYCLEVAVKALIDTYKSDIFTRDKHQDLMPRRIDDAIRFATTLHDMLVQKFAV